MAVSVKCEQDAPAGDKCQQQMKPLFSIYVQYQEWRERFTAYARSPVWAKSRQCDKRGQIKFLTDLMLLLGVNSFPLSSDTDHSTISLFLL